MTEESFSETYLFGVVDCSNGNDSLLTPLDPLPRGCKSIFTLVPGEEYEGIFGSV